MLKKAIIIEFSCEGMMSAIEQKMMIQYGAEPVSFRILMFVVSVGKAGVALAGGMLAVLGALDLVFGTNSSGFYALHVRDNVETFVTAAGVFGVLLGAVINR